MSNKQLLSIRLVLGACLVLLVISCSAPREKSYIKKDAGEISIKPTETLYIQIALYDDVSFHGEYTYDNADQESGNVLYPADNAAVFLAAIFTHAVTAHSMNEGVKTGIRSQADKVLEAYDEYLKGYSNEALLASVLNELNQSHNFYITKLTDNVIQQSLVLRSEPVFFMTQDQQEIILKHAMTVHRYNDPENILFKNIIELASKRVDPDNKAAYWVEDNRMKQVSGELYAASFELFINDLLGEYESLTHPQKTYRYRQGGKKRYERGTLISHQCGQTTIRTLRGWLKSFHVDNDKAGQVEADCTTKSQKYLQADI